MARFEDKHFALERSRPSVPLLDAAVIEVARRYVSPENKPPVAQILPRSYRLSDAANRSWALDVYPNPEGPYSVVVSVDHKPVRKWGDKRGFIELVVDFGNQAALRQQSGGNATHVEAIIQRAKLAAYDLGLNAPIDFHPSAPPYHPPVDDLPEERRAELRALDAKRSAYKRVMITGGPSGYR